MKRRILMAALAIAGGLVATAAQAAVTLPSGATDIRFTDTAVFATNGLPTIDVTTGQLLTNNNPVSLTAFGQIEKIVDVTPGQSPGSPPNYGQINGELTFSYTGATLTPISASPDAAFAADPTNATSVTWTITSKVNGGQINVYDKNVANFNTAAYIGQPLAGVPSGINDGGANPLYLQANSPSNAVGTIVISYSRLNTASNYDSFQVLVQHLNGDAFTITGGSILADHPGLQGTKLTASQNGSLSGTIADLTGTPTLTEAGFQLDVHNNVIPEPASLGLLGVAGMLLLSGRRTWRSIA